MATGGSDSEEQQGLSEIRQLQLDFWTEFVQELQDTSQLIKPRKPYPQNWMEFSIGIWGNWLGAAINVRQSYACVYLGIGGPNKQKHYEQLLAQREDIEAELGGKLVWHALPEKKSSYAVLGQDDCHLRDRAKWPKLHQWMADRLEALHRSFSDRVQSLDGNG